jgi:hypothetical protein
LAASWGVPFFEVSATVSQQSVVTVVDYLLQLELSVDLIAIFGSKGVSFQITRVITCKVGKRSFVEAYNESTSSTVLLESYEKRDEQPSRELFIPKDDEEEEHQKVLSRSRKKRKEEKDISQDKPSGPPVSFSSIQRPGVPPPPTSPIVPMQSSLSSSSVVSPKPQPEKPKRYILIERM